SRFLIGQPKGQRALTMPNEEGETPLQLAQRRGDRSLFMAAAISFPPLSLPDSPSLVALVMDSEEDEVGVLVKSPLSTISPLASDPRSSGDDTSPDLTCTRTQSASSDGDPTLAKVPGCSLLLNPHTQTLTNVLGIEEEEWDKYNIPSKVESEKYKVIRTFSFLKSRMSTTRNKNKVRHYIQCLAKVFIPLGVFPILLHYNLKIVIMIFWDDTYCMLLTYCHCPGRLSESPESDSRWCPGQSEELLQTTESSTSTDSSLGEDCVDASLHSDLDADAVDYEAESWSLTVEHTFCKKQDKRVVKRQDVIYEFMQTEMHHLQTLRIMAEVFRRGMREEVQLDAGAVDRVFPCLDELLLLHHNLFNAMRERRHSSAQPHGDRNYVIVRIGDILLQQFSEDSAERMKQVYGEFCSHHTEAVTFFKELQQHNKRFQTFIKVRLACLRGYIIPECILLVTQRITKYPVLLERILQYTQEDSEEHRDLSRALVLIKEVIAAVDLMVSEFEQGQRLQDVLNRMENRSFAKLKNGHTFRKQDVLGPGQTLKHQGLLLWKTATGRLKDVMALLLTDTLIFLQEKDQKFIFAAVDQKPPVISLQKLIVREVANEERGMFLISASAAGPEMYEVHTSSKDERNTWMRLIREAVESCPEEEEENTKESEEERRTAEARVQKIHKLQETLSSQDYQICSSLEEKLQIYAELSALRGEAQEPHPEPHLLVQPNPEEVPQAAVLLTATLREGETIYLTISLTDHPSPPTPLDTPSDAEASLGDPNTRDGESASQVLVLQSLTNNINLKVGLSSQPASQSRYRHIFVSSLQAAVTIQDSFFEVQKLLLHESDRHSPRSLRPHTPCLRGNALQEQEKQRNLEKRREEVAAAVRLQGRLHQERQRWERECQARHSQQGELESRLEERERQCHLEVERLKQEREELEEQLGEYQQSLERLRESQRSVEKERERLETQQNLLQSWRHSRQRSLPVMVIPLDRCHQVCVRGVSGYSLHECE
uniref:Rho guanine nucleotide exchange factor (GEF) 28a n=1 Tax=Hucho hucho TaxID=62062 RepID=A0A4W5KBS1_9TELE